MLFGMGSKLLYAASRIALPPLALSHMELGDYGLWSACFVLVSYVGMAASGFSLVYLRETAKHHVVGDVAAISRLLSTGIFTMAALAMLLLSALTLAMPALLSLMRVPTEQHALASQLWLGAVAVFLADMSLGAFAHVLHATGRLRLEQKVWVAAFVLEALLIVFFLQMGMGAQGLLLAFAGRYLFSSLTNARLAWRGLPGLRISPRLFDASLLRGFFVYGSGMQLSGLISTALASADRLLAGSLLGPAAAALADLASKLPVSASAASSSISHVAVSATARHDARGEAEAIHQVYRDAMRLTVGSLALIMPFLALLAPLLCLAWLGTQGPHAMVASLMPWLVLMQHCHLLTGPATALARGRGRLDMDYLYHALRAVMLLLAIGWVLWQGVQLQRLLMALCLSQGAAALLFLVLAQRQLLGLSGDLLRHCAMPSALAYGLAFLLTMPLDIANLSRPQALSMVVAALAMWLPLACLLLASTLLKPSEVRQLLQRLRKRLPIKNRENTA